jgi:hypothetical protein
LISLPDLVSLVNYAKDKILELSEYELQNKSKRKAPDFLWIVRFPF